MPTDRAQNRPFYGWIALVLAALGMVATLPGRTQGLGLITTPLLRELHLSDVQWANINLVATLIGASFCIGFGRLIDRWGARRVMSGVIALLGLDLLAMSQARGLWSLFFTVTLTRGLGQSALSVVSLAIVGKWFIRRLPIAMGAYSVLIGIGFMIAFPAVQYAVEKDGWRAVWVGAGLVMIFVIAPLCALFMRRTPESIGLLPDGDHSPTSWSARETAESSIAGLTVGEALRTPAFWAFGLASAAFGLISSGILLFNQDLLDELGFGSDVFRMVLAVSALTGLLANFVGGWLAQKWPMGRLMGLAMFLMAVALATLPAARTRTHVLAYAIAMGVSGGIVTVVFFTCWGRMFGRRHLGKIQGAAQLMTVLASAAGPSLLALSEHTVGSYKPLLYGAAPVAGLLGVLCWAAPEPRMSLATQTASEATFT